MTPTQLDRRPVTPVYAQIAAHYVEMIHGGEIRAGGQFPSIAEICETWHVAPATAARVIKTLGRDGLVETHWGKGTFVSTA